VGGRGEKSLFSILLTSPLPLIQRGLRVSDDPKSEAFARTIVEMLDSTH
jgi:hypothetical protein